MAWTTVKIPISDMIVFQDRIGQLQLAAAATGDRTSYKIYDAPDFQTGLSTLYFPPEASRLFRAELARHECSTAEELPPEGDRGIFIELLWP